jgi:hypothetical protein
MFVCPCVRRLSEMTVDIICALSTILKIRAARHKTLTQQKNKCVFKDKAVHSKASTIKLLRT